MILIAFTISFPQKTRSSNIIFLIFLDCKRCMQQTRIKHCNHENIMIQIHPQQGTCPSKHAYPLLSSYCPLHGDYLDITDDNNEDEYKLENTTSPASNRPQSELPGSWDVICARGKQTYNHPGNEYFRKLVLAATSKYSQARTKMERTIIVSEIVDSVRSRGNGFVRQNERKEWVEVNDVVAREKTGQQFRNLLGNRYKSSVVGKRRRREQTAPTVIGNLREVVFSNTQVGHIMATVMNQVLCSTDDDLVFEKLCDANMELLRVFKLNPDLTYRFNRCMT
jgi:hypothetical protein